MNHKAGHITAFYQNFGSNNFFNTVKGIVYYILLTVDIHLIVLAISMLLVTNHSAKYCAILLINAYITEKHIMLKEDILFTNPLAGKGLKLMFRCIYFRTSFFVKYQLLYVCVSVRSLMIFCKADA